jgi:Caspase domain
MPNPRRDAKLVAEALRQAGFETLELTDLDRVGMAKALGAFRAKAASADWALIYFAGHGIEINRVNYLIPIDAKLGDSGDVELETISYEALLNAIGGCQGPTDHHPRCLPQQSVQGADASDGGRCAAASTAASPHRQKPSRERWWSIPRRRDRQQLTGTA